MAHENKIGYFYSDWRDKLHSQKLSHQESTDLLTWGPIVNDARDSNYTIRPGMTSIAEMGNGKFLFTYEVDKLQGFPAYAHQPLNYKIADSPFEFDSATPYPIVSANDNVTASSAPQVIWSPAGGKNGTIVVTASHEESFFLNTKYGDPKARIRVDSGHGVGYSRALQIIPSTDGKVVLVFNGGSWESHTPKSVTCGDYVIPGPGSSEDTISQCSNPLASSSEDYDE